MKENTQKPSVFVLLSIVVVVVCILLFRQCSDGKPIRETAIDSSSPVTNVKKEVVEKAEKKSLTEKVHIAESQKKGNDLNVQSLVAEKKAASKATKKLDATSTYGKKTESPLIQKKSQVDISKYSDDDSEDRKLKTEGILQNELEALTIKINVLEERINAIWETLRIFSEEKKNRMLVENINVEEKEAGADSTRIDDTLKRDDVIFKYPTHVLSGGLSSYEKWTGLGFQASYTYRISKFVSLGGQGNAFLKEGKYNGDRDFYLGFRANFHMFSFFVENSRFDLYAGGTGGVGRDDSVETFETMWCLGAAYDFNNNWGVFIEAGNIGVVGLRMTF